MSTNIDIDFNLLCWNINGVKNKFLSENVKNILNQNDIVILSETHFNIRTKCPEGFYLVGRSKSTESKKSRGGVAVYKNISSNLKLSVISETFKDCIIFEICNTAIVIVAMYIPPYNSTYFDETYFHNLDLIMNHFSERQVFVMGDLNCRTGTPTHEDLCYKTNPDIVINNNGKSLLQILERYKKWNIINGAIFNNRVFDTKYTFFRGEVQSQNDICITNWMNDVKTFKICSKLIESDHCPCRMAFSSKVSPDLRLVEECSRNFKTHDHYDINRRIPKTVDLSRVNITRLYNDLEALAAELQNELSEGASNNWICNKLTNNIYSMCMNNYRPKETSNLDVGLVK